MSTAPRRWTSVDRGMVTLVRLVLDDDWHPVESARRLRGMVNDPQVLTRIARRLARPTEVGPSWIARRASVTVANAVGPTDAPDREG